jgi:hypothetical protein
MGLAVLGDATVGRLFFGEPRLRSQSQWELAIEQLVNGERPRVLASIYMADGSTFRGEVKRFTLERPMEQREITLIHPIVRVNRTNDSESIEEIPDTLLVIPGSQIQAVGSIYWFDPPSP